MDYFGYTKLDLSIIEFELKRSILLTFRFLDEIAYSEAPWLIHKFLCSKGIGMNIHPDPLAAQKLVYEPGSFRISNLIKESESKEYGAFEFKLNDRQVKFRVAKIIHPTKNAQWKSFIHKNRLSLAPATLT